MIGDVLTSSILFEAIKAKYFDAELHYVVNTHTYPVVKKHPLIDKFIFINAETESNKLLFLKFLNSIRKERYDYVIDVYGKISSALICLFAKSKIKIAYHKRHSSFIYSHTVKRLQKPENNSSLALENRMRLLEPLGINFSNILPKIYLSKKEIEQSRTILKTHKVDFKKNLYMISVLGSCEKKTYPLKYIAELIDTIAGNGNAQILFNYIPKQKHDAQKVLDYCKPQTKKHIFFNLYGKNLREFMAITYHCKALIGNEGGANNIAKALNISTFTIFSPGLNKQNWFGNVETNKHVAIHLSDFLKLSETDISLAKKNTKSYYLKLKPQFIIPQLKTFLSHLD